MSVQITSLLHRRPDLSTFLVHLTAASANAETNLLSILSDRAIEARNPYGLLRSHASDTRAANPALYQSQLVVCLTETPLEHVWMMCEHIADRGHPSLDPTWGLERMIAALANVPEEYAGPLPWY
jgi:hypothetical protein